MDRTTKLFLFFCFAVFFFTGCNRKSSQAAVSGPKSGAADSKKAGKVVPQPTAELISLSIQMFDEMDQIYRQIVPKAAGIKKVDDPTTGEPTLAGTDVSLPKNVFQVLSSLMQVEYTKEGQGQPSNPKEKQCVTGKPHLNPTQKKEGDPNSTVFVLNYNLCQGTKASYKLASWERDTTGHWVFSFSVRNLNVEGFEAYGKFGGNLENLASGCSVKIDDKEKRIATFTCANLSTDVKGPNEVESTKSLYLGEINYDRQADVQLTLKGTLFDRSVVPPKELPLVVTDIPKVNTLTIKAFPKEEPKSGAPAADGNTSKEAGNDQGNSETQPAQNSGDSVNQAGSADGQAQQPGAKESKNQPSGDAQHGNSQAQPGDSQNGNEQQGDGQPNPDQQQQQGAKPPPEAVT